MDQIANQVEKLYELLKVEKPTQIKLLPPTANKNDDMGYDGKKYSQQTNCKRFGQRSRLLVLVNLINKTQVHWSQFALKQSVEATSATFQRNFIFQFLLQTRTTILLEVKYGNSSLETLVHVSV